MKRLVAAALVLAASIAEATPRKGRFEVTLGYDTWEVTAPGAQHSRSGKYDHQLATKTWSIKVMEWPRSSVFMQKLSESLAARRKRHPDLVVLQQDEVSDSDWALVVETGSGVQGTIMRPGGRGSNAMCTFTIAPSKTQTAAVKSALAACKSLVHRGPAARSI